MHECIICTVSHNIKPTHAYWTSGQHDANTPHDILHEILVKSYTL